MSNFYNNHPYQQPDWQVVPRCSCVAGYFNETCPYAQQRDEVSLKRDIYWEHEDAAQDISRFDGDST